VSDLWGANSETGLLAGVFFNAEMGENGHLFAEAYQLSNIFQCGIVKIRAYQKLRRKQNQ